MVAALAGCGVSSGSLDLVLSLPPTGDLRPTGMTTVGITEVQADGTSNVTTTQLVQSGSSMHFSAGDVIADQPITLSAELRDTTNRLVGYGAVTAPVTPSSTDDTSVTLQVRKPIVYVSSDPSMPQAVSTYDPTRDPIIDPKYQGALTPAAVVVAPIDGSEVAVVTASSVQRFATATHMPIGSSIPITFGTPLDAAAVPGQRRLVVGTTSGLAIITIDSGQVTTINGARADRVTAAVDSGVATAYLLTGRVTPAIGAMGTCSGSSTVYSVAIDTMGAPVQLATGQLADIAADGKAVFGADPCGGQVRRLDPGGALKLPLPGAATVAVESQRLWAAGSSPSTMTGARIVLASIGLDGNTPRQVELSPKSEIVTYDGDPLHELSIFLHADTEIPIDLAVLPTADRVALIARMDGYSVERDDSFGPVIPAMQATVWDVLLSDPNTGATTRVRALCNLKVINGSQAEFPNWSCADPNEGEAPAGGEYTPGTISAVYGGR
jgi:hypothetical protein